MFENLSSRAVKGLMAAELAAAPVPPWVLQASMFSTSDQAMETYRMLTRHPGYSKWTGKRKAIPPNERGVTVYNDLFEATFGVSLTDLRRDKTDQLRAYIAGMLGGSGDHWASMLVTLMLNGETTVSTYGTWATLDELDFFIRSADGTKHAGSQYNVVEISGFSSRITTAQAMDGVAQALELMAGFHDGNGNPVNNGMSGIAIVVPPSCLGGVAAALDIDMIQGTGGPVQNVATSLSKALGVQVTLASEARLGVQSGWGTGSTRRAVMIRTDDPIKGFLRQEELAPTISAKAEGSDYEHDYHAHEYGVAANRGAGYGRWENACLIEWKA